MYNIYSPARLTKIVIKKKNLERNCDSKIQAGSAVSNGNIRNYKFFATQPVTQ